MTEDGLRVGRVEIFDKDHSGGADIEPANHLPLVDRLAICLAGINANDMFEAPMHELAEFGDHVMVYELVSDIPEPESDVLREQGHQRAWDLLKAHAKASRTLPRNCSHTARST
jgi:hypothetical protein